MRIYRRLARSDIAVLRADKKTVFGINENVSAVKLAEDYRVGESVYAIGNAKGEGITATEGIVSVDNEYIALDIDETAQMKVTVPFASTLLFITAIRAAVIQYAGRTHRHHQCGHRRIRKHLLCHSRFHRRRSSRKYLVLLQRRQRGYGGRI